MHFEDSSPSKVCTKNAKIRSGSNIPVINNGDAMKKDSSENSSVTTARKVRVFPCENGWTVGIGSRSGALPFSKNEAITKAIVQAMRANVPTIAILDQLGRVEELVPVA